MAFMDGKERSKGFVRRVASSFSMRNKKTNATTTTTSTRGGEPKLLPRSKSTGSTTTNYDGSMKLLPSKKVSNHAMIKSSSASVTPLVLPRREKIDDRGDGTTKKSFGKWRSFDDDSDSIWLSSDCASSPTSLLEERRFSVSFRFSVDDSVVSWLSNLANTCSSHQEASSVKDRCRIPRKANENAEKNILLKTVLDHSLSMSSQGKRVSFSPSSGTEPETENSCPFLVLEKSSDEENSKIVDSKKSSNVVEPIFWPYEQRFDWTPEDILKHFTMSPRRKKSLSAKVSGGTSPRSMRAALLQTRKLDLKDGSKRKLVVTNASSKIPELKRTSSYKKTESTKKEPIKNCVKRNKSLPSRLRKSSSKVVPVEEEAVVEQQVIETEKAKAETTKKLINRRSKTMLEDDFSFLNDSSIETAVGLDEFKGQEGIDSEFNSEAFLFDDTF